VLERSIGAAETQDGGEISAVIGGPPEDHGFGESSGITSTHEPFLHEPDGGGGAISVAGEGVVKGNGSDRTNPLQYLESPRLSASEGGQNAGPKKTQWTDAIFENVKLVNTQADADPETIRISVDTKATVNIGLYSRGGRSRGLKAVQAADHDMMPKEKLAPGGILETANGKSFLFFTSSHKTSDFVVDGIDRWWMVSQERLATVKRLVVNLDNGPECSGHRSQFLQRMVEFADREKREVRLIYYPPYHSKYNSIERYWGGLERSWNGYLLNSVEMVLRRASSFIWRTVRTTVTLMEGVYEKGIKVSGKGKRELERRLQRSERLPWWDITIYPLKVH
jgi:hypothetical protein